jgi:hypothetical protein
VLKERETRICENVFLPCQLGVLLRNETSDSGKNTAMHCSPEQDISPGSSQKADMVHAIIPFG